MWYHKLTVLGLDLATFDMILRWQPFNTNLFEFVL